jgi:signal transduction histidine kinase
MLSLHAHDTEMFAARAAHDLRAPLQAIQLSLELLDRGRPDQEPAARQRLRSSVERMRATIDGLLDIPMVAVGPKHRAPAAEILQTVTADLSSEIASAHADVTCRVAPDLDAAIAPPHLRAVLQNLIGNSVKYLREDGPKNITVSAERRRGRVKIEVSDAGKGIPRSALERVFETGFRAEEAKPGLGIGLATVKRLVDGYGGRVVLRSREGYGTNACVELPAAEPRGRADPGA